MDLSSSRLYGVQSALKQRNSMHVCCKCLSRVKIIVTSRLCTHDTCMCRGSHVHVHVHGGCTITAVSASTDMIFPRPSAPPTSPLRGSSAATSHARAACKARWGRGGGAGAGSCSQRADVRKHMVHAARAVASSQRLHRLAVRTQQL